MTVWRIYLRFSCLRMEEHTRYECCSANCLSYLQSLLCRTSPLSVPFVCLDLAKFADIVPTGRDPDWVSLHITFAVNLTSAARKTNLFPVWLKPWASISDCTLKELNPVVSL
jgi:hypothetical protein